jgi:hypothetical protein
MAVLWSDSTSNGAVRWAQPSPSSVPDIRAGFPSGHVTRTFSTIEKLKQDAAHVLGKFVTEGEPEPVPRRALSNTASDQQAGKR